MTISASPFGPELAAAVADLLARDGRVLGGWSAHWMLKKGDRLVYEVLKDSPREVFATSSEAAFAAWLSAQSPRSLDDLVRPGCGDLVEVITHEALAEAVATNAGVHDATPFGADLAQAVADALDRGVSIAHTHRDYCGMGLAREEGGYRYAPVYDGWLHDGALFPTRAAFVAWLAEQSDASLSGREGASPFDWDNQRITRARLLEALAS